MRFRSLAWCAVALSLPALAGDLNPPMGPPTPTMKTLDEIEPRTIITQNDIPLVITENGSYALAENIIAPLASSAAITIQAPLVTLDLRGFSITRAPADSGDRHGILVIGDPAQAESIEIRSGAIAGHPSAGVMSGDDVDALRLIDLRISDCFTGVHAHNATVSRCESSDNELDGFLLYSSALVTDSAAHRNGGAGFLFFAGATVSRCVANFNSSGIVFDDAGEPDNSRGSLTDSSAHANEFDGIYAAGRITLSNCAASATTNGAGFVLRGSSAINCVSSNNDTFGFDMRAASAIQCLAVETGVAGFITGGGSSVRECHASFCEIGISAGDGSTAVANTVVDNEIGIYVSLVSVAGQDAGCRIEANHLDQNDVAIRLDEDGSIVIANTIHDSFTADIVNNGDNVLGEIIDLSASGGVLTSTNPWANIIH